MTQPAFSPGRCHGCTWLVIVCLCLAAGPGSSGVAAEPATFTNPINPGPDPWLLFHEGHYYLTTTQGRSIRMWKAPTLAALKTVAPVTVWTDDEPTRSHGIWAPEFHFMDGRWYLYYTAMAATRVDTTHRMHVLESEGTDPLGPYHYRGRVFDPTNDQYAIDGSVFRHPGDGAWYFLWAAHPGHVINIARMENPWTLATPGVVIPASGFGCEEVREGPVVLQRNGRLFLTYSACDTGKPDYKIGMLIADDRADVMNPESWQQVPDPVFERNDAAGVFGPGHHGFFQSPDGTEDWIVYHGKTSSEYTYRGRTTRAQKFTWNADGTPNFGKPYALDQILAEPSGGPEEATGDIVTLNLQPSSGTPEVWQRQEMGVEGMPAAVNPFDPEVIALDLEVTEPSGRTMRVPGFFTKDFNRTLEGQQEVLTSPEPGRWCLRWLAREPGSHHLVATATVRGRVAARGETVLQVAAGTRPGLIRVEPESQRYFCRDDGTPLFLRGLCVGWYGSRGTHDYDDWLAAYQQAGINYMRIWMWPNAFGIEWDRGDRLQYRLDNAWRLDYVLAEAEQRGVNVMLCLDYHGIFEVKPDYWGTNNYWTRHPYNAGNGGPCDTQNDFFTGDQAKALYEKRLRYIVARWSAFPNLLAWEFFNEIDNEYAYLKHEDVVAWHRDMGRRLRGLDPYGHLISSSFTGGSERPDLFALPEMDFAQYHSYNEPRPARMTAEKTERFFARYHKPFFVSEYGTDWRGWKPDTDPHFRALHQAIWSGAFTGAAGTGMTWWWESIHTANLYHHWSALTTFLQGTGLGGADWAPARFEGVEASLTPYGVAGSDEALVWLLDRSYDWPEGAMQADPVPLTGAAVTLAGVDDGVWTVQWWNTLTGKPGSQERVTAAQGRLSLKVPSFQVDIAVHLKKR